jgi:hypothetical protein
LHGKYENNLDFKGVTLMATLHRVQQKRVKRNLVSRDKKRAKNRKMNQDFIIMKALKQFKRVEINSATDMEKFVDHLDPNEYGKTWGISDENSELKEKMDRIVADELQRRAEEEIVQTTDGGKLKIAPKQKDTIL